MVLNDTTNKQGIFQDIDFLVDTNITIYPAADKVRNINASLDEAVSIIIGADGNWQFDDTNYTTLPIGTTNLVSGQQDYSFSDTYLTIEAIEVKDASGTWIRLEPIDLYPDYNRTLNGSISNFMSTSGTPQYYDKVGDSIFLYPKPNYNSTAGLKAFFQRKMDPFTASDTTKEPGFAPHLHRFCSISASYDWAVAKSHAKMNFLLNEKNRYAKMIKDFYGTRRKDETKIMRPGYQNNK